MGLGFVVRDDRARQSYPRRDKSAAAGNSILIEALAMRFGVQKALEQGLNHLSLESDSRKLDYGSGWEDGGGPVLYAHCGRSSVLEW